MHHKMARRGLSDPNRAFVFLGIGVFFGEACTKVGANPSFRSRFLNGFRGLNEYSIDEDSSFRKGWVRSGRDGVVRLCGCAAKSQFFAAQLERQAGYRGEPDPLWR